MRRTHWLCLGVIALGTVLALREWRAGSGPVDELVPHDAPASVERARGSEPVVAEVAPPTAARTEVAASDEPPVRSLLGPRWTLRFVGSKGERLPELDATVAFWLGADSELRRLPDDARTELGATWILDIEEWVGARAQVHASARGFAPTRESWTVRAGEGHTIALGVGASVVGRVVGDLGEPVPGADVFLLAVDSSGDRFELSRGSSDDEGRFRLGTIASGLCEISATKQHVGQSVPLQRRLETHDHWEVGDVALLGGGVLSGRVVFPGGEPVADLWLGAERQGGAEGEAGTARSQLRTDSRGEFRFTGLSAQSEYQLEHSLRAVEPFGEPGRARADGAELRLVLQAGRVIARALDEDDRPVDIQTIELFDEAANERRYAETSLKAKASATLYLTPQRPYKVTGKDFADRPFEGRVELAAGETERELILRPPDPAGLASLRLALFEPGGEPLSSYQATLNAETGGYTHLSAPIDLVDGAFPGLPPGVHELRIKISRIPGGTDLYFPEGERRVELFPGRETSVTWTCQRGGRVELDLRGVPKLRDHHAARLSGRPTDDAAASFLALHVFRRRDEGFILTTTAPLGEVWQTEKPLTPGSWVLRLEADGYRLWEQAVVVRAGEVTSVKVELEPE